MECVVHVSSPYDKNSDVESVSLPLVVPYFSSVFLRVLSFCFICSFVFCSFFSIFLIFSSSHQFKIPHLFIFSFSSLSLFFSALVLLLSSSSLVMDILCLPGLFFCLFCCQQNTPFVFKFIVCLKPDSLGFVSFISLSFYLDL